METRTPRRRKESKLEAEGRRASGWCWVETQGRWQRTEWWKWMETKGIRQQAEWWKCLEAQGIREQTGRRRWVETQGTRQQAERREWMEAQGAWQQAEWRERVEAQGAWQQAEWRKRVEAQGAGSTAEWRAPSAFTRSAEARRRRWWRAVIIHLVLFRVSPTLTAHDCEAFVGALENALVDIPLIQRAMVGRRVKINAGYEAGMPHYDYAAALEFASEADLRSYLAHPAHAELGMRLFASAEAVLAYDFDAVSGDRLRELVNDLATS